MYQDFSKIYDALMQEIDYVQWADYLFRIMLNHPKEITSILEFGCGTGNITCELAKKNFQLTAVDISEDMLMVADEKATQQGLHNISFFLGDMSSFQIEQTFDAVIACCDAVNYLTSIEQVQAFLYCSQLALKDRGLLIFDINTSSKYKEKIGDHTFTYDLEDLFCSWQNNPNFKEGYIDYDLTFFVEGEDGRYDRYAETQRQYLYKVEDIYRCLKHLDYKDIKIYNFGTFHQGSNHNDRVVFVAEK